MDMPNIAQRGLKNISTSKELLISISGCYKQNKKSNVYSSFVGGYNNRLSLRLCGRDAA